MKFRELTANEIECRVAQVFEDKGSILLLYKDARCDMNILDETVGCENWTRSHEVVNGNLFCNVGIKIPKGDSREFAEWVFKQDVGTESFTEKEKGQSSDSFKRACFNWGIGRELYTAPFIYVPLTAKDGQANYDVDAKNKPKATFKVTYIKIVDGKITGLNIENTKKRRTVYAWGDIS